MPVVIDGTGTIGGLAAGGLPDGTVTTSEIANSAITPSKLSSDAQYYGFKNRIINGAMAINQRGTQTGSPLSGYTLDRWLFSRTGTGTSTVSQLASSNYGGRYAMNISSAHAAGEIFGIEQRIEAANSADMAGSTVIVQFYASATTSAGSLQTFYLSLSYATATDNFTSATSIGSVTFTPTSTPTLFTASFSVPSAATTGLKLQFGGGQAGATGTITFILGGVQLEKGSTATSFDYRPYGTELALCQRYYLGRSGNNDVTFGYLNGNNVVGSVSFPVYMRANPTVVIGSVLNINKVSQIGSVERDVDSVTGISQRGFRTIGNNAGTFGSSPFPWYEFNFTASAEL